MAIEIKSPTFPESVADGVVATWYKKPGEAVSRDELLVDIETDKVVLEVVAPADGVLEEIIKNEGETVLSNELLAVFNDGASAPTLSTETAVPPSDAVDAAIVVDAEKDIIMSPSARRMVEEKKLDPATVEATGKGGRLTKEDVVKHLSSTSTSTSTSTPTSTATTSATVSAAPSVDLGAGKGAMPVIESPAANRPEKRVPMTRLRASVARRLLEAQQNSAMLTTFNEVNMKPIMELRKQYKDLFEKKHNGVKLGFMSFFVKAACEALRRFPAVNASIDGNDIVYHGYQDVGVAVSSDRGLVVPVLRDAEQMGLAEIESAIVGLGSKARDGKLSIDEMTGGTFTISNGGVFGSLMSTPILNPPQTAILGMHKIQERPMAVNSQVVVLPMMYLALSYDHRMIDGKEAVQFLVAIKEMLEDPARIILEV